MLSWYPGRSGLATHVLTSATHSESGPRSGGLREGRSRFVRRLVLTSRAETTSAKKETRGSSVSLPAPHRIAKVTMSPLGDHATKLMREPSGMPVMWRSSSCTGRTDKHVNVCAAPLRPALNMQGDTLRAIATRQWGWPLGVCARLLPRKKRTGFESLGSIAMDSPVLWDMREREFCCGSMRSPERGWSGRTRVGG